MPGRAKVYRILHGKPGVEQPPCPRRTGAEGVKPAAFTYRRVHSADEAVAALVELGDEAKLVAGGQSLVPMMNFRLARPEALVDIGRLDELRFVRAEGDGRLRVGALTRHRDLEHLAPELRDAGFAILPSAARFIGHYAIRASGTFGGSIAHADPAAEWCMVAQLLDAEITILGRSGTRTVAGADMFKGFLETDLAPDEMIVDVALRGFGQTAIQEMCRRQGDFAVVAAAVALDTDAGPGGTCREARVVLGGVGGTVVRVPEAEAALVGSPPSAGSFAAAAEAASQAIDPPGDLNGPPEYRRHLAAVLVRRALEDASSGALAASIA